MQAATALDARDLALDLHTLLRSMDPVAWRADAEASLRRRLATVQLRASRLASRRSRLPGHERIRDLHRTVREARPRGRAQWMALRRRLVPLYDGLEDALSKAQIDVPAHRPTNWLRSALHVGTAVLVVALIAAWVHTPIRMLAVTGPLVVGVWLLELTRWLSPRWNGVLMRSLGPVAHAHEHRRVNSATWYVTALFALALVGDPVAAAVGVAVLGLGDPIAGFVGRRWGSIRIRDGRSVQGSLAFVIGAALAAVGVVFGLCVLGLMAWPSLVALTALVLGAGVVGAAAELVADRIDDNLLVPLAAGVFAAGMLAM